MEEGGGRPRNVAGRKIWKDIPSRGTVGGQQGFGDSQMLFIFVRVCVFACQCNVCGQPTLALDAAPDSAVCPGPG